jgi:Rrf2 family protein
MKLNTKTRYGIRTMIELALDWEGHGLFQKDISERQQISYKYLDHIVSALKTKGLIVNMDGKKSGYRLSRKPEEITVYDIYMAFEPELTIVDCLGNDGECKSDRTCAARHLWGGLNKLIIDYLKDNNLKELADLQLKLTKGEAANMFYI